MKVSKNKQYITRNGLITTPTTYWKEGGGYCFEAQIQEEKYFTQSHYAWKVNGKFLTNLINHELDLVAEVDEDFIEWFNGDSIISTIDNRFVEQTTQWRKKFSAKELVEFYNTQYGD